MSDVAFDLIPPSYTGLDADAVLATETAIKDLWRAADNTLDVENGAIAALVVRPAAALLQVGRETFQTARRSSSLTSLLDASDAVSLAMLDEVAASYRVTRKSGKAAYGLIRLFFSQDLYQVVGVTTQFRANGVLFNLRTAETLIVSTDAPSTLPNYQSLRKTEDGSNLFYADVTVYSRTEGIIGNLIRGTELFLYESVLPYFVRALALETFQGGDDTEPNDQLIQRMRYGISAKVLSSRVNMKAALIDQFPDIRDSSIIGAGDPEMTRDKHTLFPGPVGGFVDWYVGTTQQLKNSSIILSPPDIQMVEERSDGSVEYKTWINDDQLSGLYRIQEVQDEESLQYCEILSQTKYLQTPPDTEDSPCPQIYDITEGAYSPYQITEVHFVAPKTLKKARLYGTHMPQIAEIQDWVLNCNQAPVGVDILVKAAIPATVCFGCALNIPTGQDIDLSLLQNKVSDYINHIPFGGTLAISQLTALLQQNLPSGGFIRNPILFAVVDLPNGENRTVQTTDRLVIDLPPYATNRTTLFFCDPSLVSISVQRTKPMGAC